MSVKAARLKKNGDIDTNVSEVKVVEGPKAERFNEKIVLEDGKKVSFDPAPINYAGWEPLTVEEAEELGLQGKLIKHDPKAKMGLVKKD